MPGIPDDPTYRQLFCAQVITLLGTGLLTVALGLLAYDLAGERAGTVLGTALAIKMLAYVGLATLANAIAEHVPRKSVLVGADLVRAVVALCIPLVEAIWQIYVLIFVLQAASATFTPTFQATIPDLLTDERDYTKALSLSRLAYDLENLLSPTLAGLLLLVMSYHWLFAGTVMGFLGSAALVWLAALPVRRIARKTRPFRDRLTRGVRIYLATPRLRGLLALNLAAAAVGAFVIVNTVVVVKWAYAGSQTDVATALAAFGAGSMLAALALPRVLEKLSDRQVMALSAGLLASYTMGYALWWLTDGLPAWPLFIAAWGLIGVLYSAILTPAGRLLRRSSHEDDRSAVFAAQFALSHACWLFTYPLAGWLATLLGLPLTLLLLGLGALVGTGMAVMIWPSGDPRIMVHDHPDLPLDHPHLRAHERLDHRHRHEHVLIIDDEHQRWPTRG
ncbi:MAG: MFS transporter [Gammaproteobacteria bacterium]|nr:MFS transporter [Gammaproteobacteria bacterium]